MPKRPYWDIVSLDSERVENPGEERTQCKDDNGNNDDDILSLCSRKLKKIFMTSGAKNGVMKTINRETEEQHIFQKK